MYQIHFDVILFSWDHECHDSFMQRAVLNAVPLGAMSLANPFVHARDWPFKRFNVNLNQLLLFKLIVSFTKFNIKR